MKRRLIDITLLLIFVFFWTISVANAGDDDHLDVAEQGADNTKTITDRAMIDVLYAEFLYGHAGSEYEKNQAKIDNGTVVTAASLLALTVQTTIGITTGKGVISITATISNALSALGLSNSITEHTSLESAYESVILSLQSKICDFESARTTYNITYDAYISMLAGHTGWTSTEVLNTIESNPSYPAVYHKDSVTTSHVHDGVLRQTYRTPSEPRDFICHSYAEYGEGNGCGTEFDLPSAARDTHYVLCGDTGDPTATDALGCNNFYYNCYSNAKERHKPRDCSREYWLLTSHGWSRVDCKFKYRICFADLGLHVNGGPGKNGLLSHGVGINSGTADSISPPGSSVPPTPSYHACGVHLTSVSGDHSWGTAPCGDATHTGYLCQINASDHEWVYESCSSGHAHYECDGTDHSWVSFCFETDSNGQSCVTSGGYSACSPHTHTYPPSLVACGGASYTGCSGASSRTEHHVPSCSNCGSSYWTCSQYAYRHTDEATCRRPGCGVTFYRCNNGTCTSNWGTRSSHWAQ